MTHRLQTPRLDLRPFLLDDAMFIRELVNEPPFLHYIGDKGVRSQGDAERYLTTGPLLSYSQHGFGLYCVERRTDGTPLGMCGLLKRDTLPHPDIGFALLERHWGQGYAVEAALACLDEARALDLPLLFALTHPDNEASARLLRKLGFRPRDPLPEAALREATQYWENRL